MTTSPIISQHSHRIMLILILVSVIFFLSLCAGSAVASASYDVYPGETVKIYVSNPVGIPAYLYIAGSNFPFTPLTDASGNQIIVRGSKRTIELDTSAIRSTSGKHPDVGTYTIYVSNNPSATSVRNLDSGNGYWDAYTLTLRPLTITVDSDSMPVGTVVQTMQPTPIPTAEPVKSEPISVPTPTPASPAPLVGLIFGLGAVILALRR